MTDPEICPLLPLSEEEWAVQFALAEEFDPREAADEDEMWGRAEREDALLRKVLGW